MKFTDAVQIVLQFEGGSTTTMDPRDPGGATRYGISKRAWPHLDIPNISEAQARAIYEVHYWNECRCSELPRLLRLAVFDCAVNMGVRRSIRMLQWATESKIDSWLGPKTIRAVMGANTQETLLRLLSRRIITYTRLPTFPVYGTGWIRRVIKVARLSRDYSE